MKPAFLLIAVVILFAFKPAQYPKRYLESARSYQRPVGGHSVQIRFGELTDR